MAKSVPVEKKQENRRELSSEESVDKLEPLTLEKLESILSNQKTEIVKEINENIAERLGELTRHSYNEQLISDLRNQLQEKEKELEKNEDEMKKFISLIKGRLKRILGSDCVGNSYADIENQVSRVHQKFEEQKESLVNLEKSISEKESVLAEKNKFIRQKDDQIAVLNNEISQINAELSQKEQHLAEKIVDLKNIIQECDCKTKDLNQTTTKLLEAQKELDSIKTQFSNVKSELDSQKSELISTKGVLEQTKTELVGCKRELDSTVNNLRKTQENLAQVKKELSDTQGQLVTAKENFEHTTNTLNASISKYESEKECFDKAVLPYMQIFEGMKKCKSLQKAILDICDVPAAGELSIENKIEFVNKFADKFTFARKIYDSMKLYKESNVEPLSSDEIYVIDLVNNFYRQRYSISFDALDCQIKAGDEFKKQKMKHITNPSNNDIMDVKFLCVPALYMMNGKDLEQKALIEGA